MNLIKMYLALALSCISCGPAYAELRESPATSPNGSFLHLDYGDLTFSKFTCNRTYLAPEISCEDWRGRAAVTFNLGILDSGFFRNYVHTEGTVAQIQTVGWKYELGTLLPWGLEAGLAHHSQHRVDEKTPYIYDSANNFLYHNKYEIEDSIFLRLIWSKK